MNAARRGLSKLMRGISYYGGVSRFLSVVNRKPRILMLHGVGTAEHPATLFRAQLIFLRRIFEIVPLERIWRDPSDTTAIPKLSLTFDDGLRNNFTAAYPILQEFRCPATFFVCPGLIDSGKWLWNHECRSRLLCLSGNERREIADSLELASYDAEVIIQKLKYMPQAKRVVFEERIARATPKFKPTDEQHREFDVMSGSELKALDPGLITIGGHSFSHQILTQLDSEHLEREVFLCKTRLESELQRPVRHFCYPDGAYNAQVMAYVGRHFVSAVTTEKAWIPSEPSLLELPRIPIPTNLPDLAWRMQRPTG